MSNVGFFHCSHRLVDPKTYFGDELSARSLQFGERVTEAANYDGGGVTGVVLDTNEGTSSVMWSGFVRPQTWANADLEPAWD